MTKFEMLSEEEQDAIITKAQNVNKEELMKAEEEAFNLFREFSKDFPTIMTDAEMGRDMESIPETMETCLKELFTKIWARYEQLAYVDPDQYMN